MRHLTKLVLLIITLAFTAYLNARLNAQEPFTQEVRGEVISAVPDDTIVGASIILVGSDPLVGTTTGSDQKFSLRLPVGRSSLQISCVGYESQEVDLLVVAGKQSVLHITLTPSDTKLDAVVVTAPYDKSTPTNRLSLAGARSFSVDEAYRFAASLGDPARMVRSFAGIMPVNDSRNDIIIRGNSPSGVQWILDGIEISNPNHFNTGVGMTGGQVSYLNTNLLTNSDFHLSAWPAPYGNALSGIFDLRLRRGNLERHEFWLQSGFGGLELGAEGYLRKGSQSSYLASYRYSVPDIMHALGFKMPVVPRYQDFTTKLHFDLGQGHTLSFVGLFSKSHIHFATNELGDSFEYADYDFSKLSYAQRIAVNATAYIAGLTHSVQFSSRTSLRTQLSFVRSDTSVPVDTMDLRGHKQSPQWHLLWSEMAQENRWTLHSDLTWHPTREGLLVAGVRGDLFDAHYLEQTADGTFAQGVRTIAEESPLYGLIRAYGQYRQRLGDYWTATVGLHSMCLTINDHYAIEPRMGVQYQPARSHTIGLAAGLYSQMLPRSFYFIRYYGPQGIEYRNKRVGFTRSAQVDLYYDWAFAPNWHAKIEGYYQELYKVPVVNDPNSIWTLLEIGGAGQNYIERQSDLVNKGRGRNYGVELTVEKFYSNNYYLLFNASLYSSTYTTGFQKEWWSTVFDGRYLVNLTGGYEWKLPKHWALFTDLKASYAGGIRYTPIREDLYKQSGRIELDKTQVNARQAKDYLRADLKIGARQIGQRITQEWAVDLQNVTNRKNVMSLLFDKGEYSTMYTQGFMPMVTYKLFFSVR